MSGQLRRHGDVRPNNCWLHAMLAHSLLQFARRDSCRQD